MTKQTHHRQYRLLPLQLTTGRYSYVPHSLTAMSVSWAIRVGSQQSASSSHSSSRSIEPTVQPTVYATLSSAPTRRRSAQGRAQDFSLAKIEGSKAESRGGVLGQGQKPPTHQIGGLRERCELPSGVPPKGFHYFRSTLMASPDTIILLLWTIMQPFGEARPRAPLAYAGSTAAPMLRSLRHDVIVCVYVSTIKRKSLIVMT